MPKKEAVKSQKLSIIKPVITTDKEHALQILFNEKDAPIITSVGFSNLPGTNTYMSYIITSKGTDILNIEVGEPNLKLIAIDEAKISFQTLIENEHHL